MARLQNYNEHVRQLLRQRAELDELLQQHEAHVQHLTQRHPPAALAHLQIPPEYHNRLQLPHATPTAAAGPSRGVSSPPPAPLPRPPWRRAMPAPPAAQAAPLTAAPPPAPAPAPVLPPSPYFPPTQPFTPSGLWASTNPQPPSLQPPPVAEPTPARERVAHKKEADQNLRPETSQSRPSGMRLGGGGSSGRTPVRTIGAVLAAILLFSVVGAATATAGPDGVTLATNRTTFAALLAREAAPPQSTHARAMSSALADFFPAAGPEMVPCARWLKDPIHKWVVADHPEASDDDKAEMATMLREQRDSFAHGLTELPAGGYNGRVGAFNIEIDKGLAASSSAARPRQPIKSRPRHYSVAEREVIDAKVAQLEDAGMVEECAAAGSDFAACPVLPMKKDALTGKMTDKRFCIDFRGLNAVTYADPYSVPFAEDLLRGVAGCPFISKMDLCAGFHQIPIDPSSRPLTAFWHNNRLLQYRTMPFGLRNATAKFQRVMDHELRAARCSSFAAAFVDDIIVYTQTWEEHIIAVRKVLQALRGVNMRVHPDKSVFGATCVEFLGVNVSARGMQIATPKVEAIKALAAPRNVPELRACLGVLNFCRGFAVGYSSLAAPLTSLLRANVVWRWGAAEADAFAAIKAALCKGITIHHPKPGCPFTLYTDFSKQGLGALLVQRDEEGQDNLCLALSRSLNDAERNYSSWEGEMLAVVWAVKSMRPYLHGVPFTIVTDHQPLTYLLSCDSM